MDASTAELLHTFRHRIEHLEALLPARRLPDDAEAVCKFARVYLYEHYKIETRGCLMGLTFADSQHLKGPISHTAYAKELIEQVVDANAHQITQASWDITDVKKVIYESLVTPTPTRRGWWR